MLASKGYYKKISCLEEASKEARYRRPEAPPQCHYAEYKAAHDQHGGDRAGVVRYGRRYVVDDRGDGVEYVGQDLRERWRARHFQISFLAPLY
jgi:hypothetical protein